MLAADGAGLGDGGWGQACARASTAHTAGLHAMHSMVLDALSVNTADLAAQADASAAGHPDACCDTRREPVAAWGSMLLLQRLPSLSRLHPKAPPDPKP